MSACGAAEHGVELIRADRFARGLSSSTLNREAAKGRMLRLRPGVFVDADRWAEAPRWVQHRALVGALAVKQPQTVFCRESALAVYGLPLLQVPRVVHRRATSLGRAGTVRSWPLPVRSILPPKTPGMSRRNSLTRKEPLNRYVDGSRTGQARVVPVPGVTLRNVGSVHAQVEQLPAVLVDTLPSIPYDDAVVVLDAAMAGRYEFGRKVADRHLDAVEILMGGGPGEDRWRFLRSFCDERSESPGESLSRLRIEQLGFVAPELQKVVHLPGQGKARLDFFWERSGVVGEFDGRIKYSRAQQLSGRSAEAVVYAEKLREDALRAAGFSMVRWTWEDLKEPEAFGRKLLAAGVVHTEIQRSFVTLSPGQRLKRFS